MKAIILIRHLETDLSGKFCGHSDPDLNAAGERRLHSLVEEVLPLGVERIYSSDLRRASRIAAAIGQCIGVAVEWRPGLREIHFGEWEGLRWEEVQLRYPREAGRWMREFPTSTAPGGEPYWQFIDRVKAEFRLLVRENRRASCAVVTHRGVMQFALTEFFGFSADEARQRTEQFGALIVATPLEVGRYRADVSCGDSVNRRPGEHRNQTR
jgi:broad specificity phosphatase PhoE